MDVVLFGACVLLSLIATVLPPNLREPVAATMRRSMVAPLMQLQKNSERWRGAYLSSVQNELVRDTLALAAARVPTLETENDVLRRMLGLGAKLQWGFIPAEALQGRGRAEDFTVTLSAGAKAGVRERSLVVAPEGVVGVVQTVDPSMSLAILFAHPDFRASAQNADASVFGIVQPHIPSGTGAEAAFLRSERYLLEMRGVPFRSALKPGAVIFSSGLGGIYPKGMPVGVVLGEMPRTNEPWARTYLLRPAVNPAELTSVMILTPERAAAGVENVWADVGAVDSLTRNIVAAGDSISKLSTTAAAAARRASIDSAARLLNDSTRRDSTARSDSATRAAAGLPPVVVTRDSATLARARRDSIAGARARRARRDSIAAAAATSPATRPDSGVRP